MSTSRKSVFARARSNQGEGKGKGEDRRGKRETYSYTTGWKEKGHNMFIYSLHRRRRPSVWRNSVSSPLLLRSSHPRSRGERLTYHTSKPPLPCHPKLTPLKTALRRRGEDRFKRALPPILLVRRRSFPSFPFSSHSCQPTVPSASPLPSLLHARTHLTTPSRISTSLPLFLSLLSLVHLATFTANTSPERASTRKPTTVEAPMIREEPCRSWESSTLLQRGEQLNGER